MTEGIKPLTNYQHLAWRRRGAINCATGFRKFSLFPNQMSKKYCFLFYIILGPEETVYFRSIH